MLLSVFQTSERLGISEVTLRRLIRFRRIPFRRIGDRILFTETDINDYLESVKVSAVSKHKDPARGGGAAKKRND
jgi:excisionase family DNA binding protein